MDLVFTKVERLVTEPPGYGDIVAVPVNVSSWPFVDEDRASICDPDGVEVWYNEWRLDENGSIFTVGDQVVMDVMPNEHHDQLVAWVGAELADEIRHELFDSSDGDPLLTVRGRISRLRELRQRRRDGAGELTVTSCELVAVSNTDDRYQRAGRGAEVVGYVLSIAEDPPITDDQIAALATAWIPVAERQARWQSQDDADIDWTTERPQ